MAREDTVKIKAANANMLKKKKRNNKRESQAGERFVVTGLLSTFFVGVASVGTTYFMRNRSRAYLSAARIKAAEEKEAEELKKKRN